MSRLAAMLMALAVVAGWSTQALGDTAGRIVFTSDRPGNDGNSEIYVMNADGSGQQRLTNNTGYDYAPVWSPDGKQIAFVMDQTRTGGTAMIYIMNADGSDLHVVPNTQTCGTADYVPGLGRPIAWSPDGTMLAFDYGPHQGIDTVRIDGSNLRTVYSGAISGGYDYYNGVNWGLGEHVILFNIQTQSNGFNQDVFSYDLASSTLTQLTHCVPSGILSQAPAGNMGSGLIAFGRQIGDIKNIYLMNSDGSNMKQLTTDTTGQDVDAMWSSDGSALTYTRLTDGGATDNIWLIGADGLGAKLITTDGMSYYASYFNGIATPEPISMIFFGTGLVGVVGYVARRRNR